MSLTRAQGFWKSSVRPDGGLEIQDRLYGTLSDINSSLPAFGEPHEDNTNCYLIKKADLQPLEGGATEESQIWTVDLMYGEDSNGWIYEIEQSPSERSIEYAKASNAKTAFLMNWKYLLAANNSTTSTWSSWSTATNPIIAPPDSEKYRWINDAAELPRDNDGKPWHVLKEKTKPGLDAFVVGSTVVRASTWYANYANYKDMLKTLLMVSGMCSKPGCAEAGNVFGLPDTTRNWLLLPEVQGRRDGYYWSITVRWMYSPEGWDSDVYWSVDD